MLDVSGVSHWYGTRQVLNEISFSVENGEILAIMGASGGGKTTLLKCISGLLRPTQGSILVDEIDVVKQPELARENMGLVFQYAALFDYLNVEDNIVFGVQRKRKLKPKDKAELVNTLLQLVSLEPEVSKLMPSELSGGMRKRVGLARALATSPKLLLYDEPTSGLDPVTAYSVDRLIVDTRNRTGMTSVVVSHDVNSVFRVADKIAFLADGELQFFGTQKDFESSNHDAIRELVDKAAAHSLGVL
ncbi:MAG: ATP-binding cassette domain-containing protein [Armatimonadetes bacterium]|nr:ATP-binding cassette domain-containing protein [Armatimonadota bacterium]